MPTISARVIKQPQKQRRCDDCTRPIHGWQVRLYGMAFRGDKPYLTYFHPECTNWQNHRAITALWEAGYRNIPKPKIAL